MTQLFTKPKRFRITIRNDATTWDILRLVMVKRTSHMQHSPELQLLTPQHDYNRQDLPPIENVPVLRHLGELGLDQFRQEHGFATPLDDRGFVNSDQLLEKIFDIVGPEYVWPEGNDIHHLQWEGADYAPSKFGGSTIPHEFREIPFHKLYIPRQMHNLIHTMTPPPEVPTYMAMRQRVKAYRRAQHLFNTAAKSIHLDYAEQVCIPLRGTQMVRIPKTLESKQWRIKASEGRNIELDVLLDAYLTFTSKYQAQLSAISLHDLDGILDEAALMTFGESTTEALDYIRSVLPIERAEHSVRPLDQLKRAV